MRSGIMASALFMSSARQCVFALALIAVGDAASRQTSATVVQSFPAVALHHDTRNARVDGLGVTKLTWPPPAPTNNTVKPLPDGNGGLEACRAACLEYINDETSPATGWSRCQAFTFDPAEDTAPCVAVVDPFDAFDPEPSTTATTGVVTWPPEACSSDVDCSLNGVCDDNLCMCESAWTGDRCQILNLAPTPTHDSGLRLVDDGANTSTWGGSVVAWQPAEDGKVEFHMFASEMVNHCGIDSWTSNSRIIRAVSDDAGGPYQRVVEVVPVFSHEPNVVMSEDGEFVIFYSATDPNSTKPVDECVCVDGTSVADCGDGAEGVSESYMIHASSPEGPWSTPQRVDLGTLEIDTNLAGVIMDDGAFVGMIRRSEAPQGSTIHLVTAEHWSAVDSYVVAAEPLFPSDVIIDSGLEDPALYLDARGRPHALFHSQLAGDDMSICGGHAFTEDASGRTGWTYSGTAWTNKIQFADGSTYTYTRRERPHAVFGDVLNPARMTHLSAGVQYGAAGGGPGQDATMTLVQPVY